MGERRSRRAVGREGANIGGDHALAHRPHLIRPHPRRQPCRTLPAVTACLDRAQPTPAEPALPFGLVVRPPWAALQPAGSVQLEAAVVEPAGDTMPLQAVAWSARSGAVRVDATGR